MVIENYDGRAKQNVKKDQVCCQRNGSCIQRWQFHLLEKKQNNRFEIIQQVFQDTIRQTRVFIRQKHGRNAAVQSIDIMLIWLVSQQV